MAIVDMATLLIKAIVVFVRNVKKGKRVMKANELMIGDYISVKPSRIPIKVAAVHHKKVAYHKVVNKLVWIRESLLESIPLTEEILEKNGFVKNKADELQHAFKLFKVDGEIII